MSFTYGSNTITYEYHPFTQILITEEHFTILAYGIDAYRRDKDGCYTKVDCIRDITTRSEKITCLLELLNRAQVSPCHFRDIVEDFLS